jgi:hypothetical protein
VLAMKLTIVRQILSEAVFENAWVRIRLTIESAAALQVQRYYRGFHTRLHFADKVAKVKIAKRNFVENRAILRI